MNEMYNLFKENPLLAGFGIFTIGTCIMRTIEAVEKHIDKRDIEVKYKDDITIKTQTSCVSVSGTN